ncbi:MAG: methyl-accepting chemotaxis protein, partial [Clostridiales bacterium]|nr:methyl-accepting chemotaxis protein [Clostridiales bacterium]
MRKNIWTLIKLAVCPAMVLAAAGWFLMEGNPNSRLFFLCLSATLLLAAVIAAISIANKMEGMLSRLRKTAGKALSVRADTKEKDEFSGLSEIISKASAERERLISELSSADNSLGEYRVTVRETVDWLNRISEGHYDDTPPFAAENRKELHSAAEAARLRVKRMDDDLKKASSDREETAETVNAAVDFLNALSAGDFSVSLEASDKYAPTNRALVEAVNHIKDALEDFAKDFLNALNGLAGSEMDSVLTGEYSGEFGAIRDSFNNMTAGLRRFITELNSAADKISASATKIAERNTGLSQDADVQASGIRELTDTVGIMTERTVDSKENAERAERLSLASKDNADRGNAEMREMMSAMQGIKDASG